MDGGDVRDGFQLAVDQSPDVSHPPGAEAGDHLGGIDVDITVIDGTDAAAAADTVKGQLSDGLTAVVIVAPEPTSQAVADRVDGTSTLLLLADGAGGSAPTEGAVRLTQRTDSVSGAAQEFAAAFERAYGRPSSPAAALGYDAGRLLDAALAGATDGVEDLASVVAAAAASSDVLVSSAVTVGATATPVPSGLSTPEDGSRNLPLLAAAAMVVLGALVGVWRRVKGAVGSCG